jgi:hypothetical protein
MHLDLRWKERDLLIMLQRNKMRHLTMTDEQIVTPTMVFFVVKDKTKLFITKLKTNARF